MKEDLLTRGYAVIEHALSEDEVTGARLYCHALCTGRMVENPALGAAIVAATEGIDPQNEVAQFLIHRGGALLKEWFQDVRYLAGAIIPKYPGEGIRPFHVDWWGWTDPVSYREIPPAVGVLFHLDATRMENGSVCVVIGSHRQPAVDEVFVRTSSGSAIILDSRALHGSMSNRTDRVRYVVTLWYVLGYEDLAEPIKARVRLSMDKKWKPILGDLYPEYDGDAEPIEHVQRPIWK